MGQSRKMLTAMGTPCSIECPSRDTQKVEQHRPLKTSLLQKLIHVVGIQRTSSNPSRLSPDQRVSGVYNSILEELGFHIDWRISNYRGYNSVLEYLAELVFGLSLQGHLSKQEFCQGNDLYFQLSITEGYPFITEGYPFITEGYPFITEGYPFITEGYPFTDTSQREHRMAS